MAGGEGSTQLTMHRGKMLEDRPLSASCPAYLEAGEGGGHDFYCDRSCEKGAVLVARLLL